MTKTSRWIILAIVIIAVVWSWYSQSSRQAAINHGAEPIKIGAILPMTGPAADYGEEDSGGISLALSEKPTIYGKRVALFIEDSKNDPKTGVAALRKLLDIDGVDFLIGEMSSVGLAVKEEINKKGIPALWIAAHPDLTKDNQWIFRNLPTALQYTKAIMDAIEQENIKDIGVFYMNDDYGESIKSSFIALFQGSVAGAEVYNKDGKDFRTGIIKLLGTKPETLFIAGYGTATGLLIKQLRESGYNGSIFGPSEIASTNSKESAGDAINGVIFPDYTPDYSIGAAKAFREKYIEVIGKEPGMDSVLGYEAARILLHAIKSTDGSREEVREALSVLRDFPGIGGPISVENNEVQYLLVLKRFVGGERVLYKK